MAPKKNLCRRTAALLAAGLAIQMVFISLAASHRLRFLAAGAAILFAEAAVCWFSLLKPFFRLKQQEEKLCKSRPLVMPEEMDAVFSTWDHQLKQVLFNSIGYQEQLRLEVKQSEYLALQNQINPHFLYNTLEAIRSDALIYGVDPIAEITQQMAGFFRYAISSLDHFVTLDEELHHVEVYMSIQRYRFGPELRLEIHSHLASDSRPLYVPKMILQPIVENAIFHGLETQEHLGVIVITIDRTNTDLYISIQDNGVGMEEEIAAKLNASFRGQAASERQGIALHNVNDRISLLFGEDYGLQVFSIAGLGTEVRIDLPMCFEENYNDR